MLKLGDVVRLKSGGPLMTVCSASGSSSGRVTCAWFVDNEIRESSFQPDTLEPAAKPAERGGVH